jgi:tetratricopeptide (TPR) repeat protein
MNDPKVYLDETNMRMTFNFRNSFVRLASKLMMEKKNDKAIQVLDKAEELMPDAKVPYNYFSLLIADLYLDLGEVQKAEAILSRLEERMTAEGDYLARFTGASAKSVEEETRRTAIILQSAQELKNKLRLLKSNPAGGLEQLLNQPEEDTTGK